MASIFYDQDPATQNLPDLPNDMGGGAPINTDISQLFGAPATPGVGGPASSPKSAVPAPKSSGFFHPTTTPPVMSPEAASVMTPEQQENIHNTDAENKAKLLGRVGLMLSLFGGLGVPLAAMGSGAVQRIQSDKMQQIQQALKQYQAQPTEPTDLDVARTGQANAATKLALDRIAHPEKYRSTGEAAAAKEGRLSQKDFANEVDRQVRETENATRMKTGGMAAFSQLEHDALAGDVEESVSHSYPGAKLNPRYQQARDLRDRLDQLIASGTPDSQVMSEILKQPEATVNGKKIKLTPFLKSQMISYMETKRQRKAVSIPGSDINPSAIPAQKPGFFQRLLNAVENK